MGDLEMLSRCHQHLRVDEARMKFGDATKGVLHSKHAVYHAVYHAIIVSTWTVSKSTSSQGWGWN